MDSLYSSDQLLQIWSKAIPVPGYNQAEYRKDVCGAWIQFSKYGDRGSSFGWEVDHVYPKSKADERGYNPDVFANLRPLQWENNKSKDADYPVYNSVTTSDGDKNVSMSQNFVVGQELQNILAQYFNL